jgi:uncharacterized protein (TIGR03437 family)
LVVGGNRSTSCFEPSSSELYDPTTGSWSAIGNLTTVYTPSQAALLTNGNVLAFGSGTSADLFDSSALNNISAASFAPGGPLAPESIASAIGVNLSAAIQAAPPGPLLTELAGVSVKIRDRVGAEHLAPLFFVSPELINYQVPSGTASGLATVIVTNGGNFVAAGLVEIAPVAPGLFSANSTGVGVAAGFWIRVAEGGVQSQDYLFDLTTRKSASLDLGPLSDQVYLSLYGTGFRGGMTATATVGGVSPPVNGFAPVTVYPGLDVVNIGPLPRSLAGRGEVDVAFSVDGRAANPLKVNIR